MGAPNPQSVLSGGRGMKKGSGPLSSVKPGLPFGLSLAALCLNFPS